MSCISAGACRHDRETAGMNHFMKQVSSSTTCNFLLVLEEYHSGLIRIITSSPTLNLLCRLCKSARSLYRVLFP